MPLNADTIATVVSANLSRLRKERGWTLDHLSKAAGVSKGMVVQIEQGRTNASIATLVRLANALGVTVADLVEDWAPATARKVRMADASVLWKGSLGGVGRLAAGLDAPVLTELWTWRLSPGEIYDGVAHPIGTREMLLIQDGALDVSAGDWRDHGEAGDLLIFAADVPHRYANMGEVAAEFLMVVLEPLLVDRSRHRLPPPM